MPVTKYVWDVTTDSYLMETDENDVTTAVYTNEPGQFGPVISQRRGANSNFFHLDALGSVVDVTGAAEDPTDSYVYKAYGEIVATAGSTANPFRWVGSLGYYYDLDLLQYYVRARHYRPVLARFLSRDPVGHDDRLHFYTYVAGRPVSRTDPTGHYSVPVERPRPCEIRRARIVTEAVQAQFVPPAQCPPQGRQQQKLAQEVASIFIEETLGNIWQNPPGLEKSEGCCDDEVCVPNMSGETRTLLNTASMTDDFWWRAIQLPPLLGGLRMLVRRRPQVLPGFVGPCTAQIDFERVRYNFTAMGYCVPQEWAEWLIE